MGKHTKENAVKLLELTKTRSDGCAPRLSSDQLPEYPDAVAQVYGQKVPPSQPARRKRGRPRTRPVLALDPQLVYGQIVKERAKGRVVRVSKRLVYAEGQTLDQTLPLDDKRFSTSYVERNNGTIRATNARFGRKTLCFSKQLQELTFSQLLNDAYYNFCRPHKGLRVCVFQGNKKWQLRTPAMAEGLTDHIWTLEELLTFRSSPISFAPT